MIDVSVKIIGGYLKLLQRVMEHYQLDFKQAGIPLDIIDQFKFSLLQPQSEAHFTAQNYVLMLEHFQHYFQRPIGLVIAEHATLQDFGLVGYLASTSLDLQQALQLFEQYYPLLYQQTNSEKLVVHHAKERITMSWDALMPEWQTFYELNIALIYKITESIVKEELIPPNYIVFGYPLRFAVYHYEKFFRTSLKSVEARYEISFSVQNLKVRNIAADQQLNQVLSHQAESVLHTVQPADHQHHQLKYKIMGLIDKALLPTTTLPEHQSLQGYLAEQLHCSERTLQRQLKAHNLNFQTLLDEYRFEKSRQLLKQAKSFSEIAERLHYADQSAFSRAFKRWSGVTPRQYIQSALQTNVKH